MLHQRITHALLFLTTVAAIACGKDNASVSGPIPDPRPTTLLRDIIIDHLPAPYYHFAYDETDRISDASFASDLRIYTLSYADGRLSEMRNNVLVNKDRLAYSYDDAGHVGEVSYSDSAGVVYTKVRFTYSREQLIGVERSRKTSGGFVVDKTMSLSYGTDANVSDVTEHHPAIAGVQDDATFSDHYEQYDTGMNVDGFSLVHTEFFDHLVLLPRVQLQRSNARLVTRSGDGLNYRVAYTYTYDDRHRPLTKIGDLTILNGADAGLHVPTSETFTYY